MHLYIYIHPGAGTGLCACPSMVSLRNARSSKLKHQTAFKEYHIQAATG